MPETTEGIEFDAMGICQACFSSEQKMRINWAEREVELRRLLDHYKARAGNNYDCIVPISGGKDSIFQLHVLVNVYKMKPLAVTFSHNWFTEVGRYNLENALERFNVDHIMFTPNRKLVNKLARRSLVKIGDSCWTCHAGIGAFPLHIAIRFNIPLLVWGESSAEESARASFRKPIMFDRDYFTRISAKEYASGMVGGDVTERDVMPFELPPVEECERLGLVGICLGDYIFWDCERQVEFVRDTYGWREDEVEGAYKHYKSVECVMAGVHDYAKWIKRGYGRGTEQVSQDIRAGLMTREEGMELAGRVDAARPEALDYFLRITGMTEDEFIETVKTHRREKMHLLPSEYLKKDRLPERPRISPAVVNLVERTNK
jgi:N-acetyl sugar amidotransferase